MERYYVGVDVGGTLLRVAKVNPLTGEFIGEVKSVSLENINENSELSKKIIEEIMSVSPPESTEGVGICAAGDIDEENLIIKTSPNSKVKGTITFPKDLKSAGYDVTITNDMKAAVQDAAKFGEGKDYENVCTATYSEGHNAAVARKCKNVTQAEMGHHLYKPDGELFCGCGKRGHLEPYVSAIGAATLAKQYFFMTNERRHPILEEVVNRLSNKNNLKNDDFSQIISKITAKDVYQAYRQQQEQEPQKFIRETQVEAIKYSFGLMTSMWNPLDIIVCMGGQTLDKDILFYGKDGAAERYKQDNGKVQLKTLKKPEIVVTERKEIGVRGAAAYYLSQR